MRVRVVGILYSTLFSLMDGGECLKRLIEGNEEPVCKGIKIKDLAQKKENLKEKLDEQLKNYKVKQFE